MPLAVKMAEKAGGSPSALSRIKFQDADMEVTRLAKKLNELLPNTTHPDSMSVRDFVSIHTELVRLLSKAVDLALTISTDAPN